MDFSYFIRAVRDDVGGLVLRSDCDVTDFAMTSLVIIAASAHTRVHHGAKSPFNFVILTCVPNPSVSNIEKNKIAQNGEIGNLEMACG